MARLFSVIFLALLALAAPASASIDDYVIGDGAVDVEGTVYTDAVDSTDDVLDGKENQPGAWTFATSGATGKVNFATVGFAVDETEDDSFLYLHFTRADLTGNASIGFVLRQSRATLPNGAPCFTPGDVLIGFNGTGTAVLDARRWVAAGDCATTGAWEASGPALDAATATGVLNGTFGEAAIDLGRLATAAGISSPCEYFTSITAHSRQSGSSGSSELGDYVAPRNLSVAACKDPGGGEDTTPPADPTISAEAGCNADGSVTLTGTASADTALVQVREGTAGRGQAIPAADGTWSVTVADVPTGAHTYNARAFDSANNVSGTASADATVDTTAPALTVTAAAGGPGQVGFVGTGEPGATITISEGDAIIATLTADGDGNWSTIVGATAGDHTYAVRASDGCGNTTAAGDIDGDGQDGVKLVVTPADSGNLGETGGPGTPPDGGVSPTCATKPFRILISKDEKRVKRVKFLVDGKKLKVVRKRDAKGRFTTMVDPSKFKPGTHQIVAKLKLRNGKTRRVKHRSFTVCGVGKCTSRLSFWMPIRRVSGDPYTKASATVAGKQAKVTRRGGRLGVKVNLIGKPKGAYKVRVRAVTESGRKVTRVRTIRTCGLKKPA